MKRRGTQMGELEADGYLVNKRPGSPGCAPQPPFSSPKTPPTPRAAEHLHLPHSSAPYDTGSSSFANLSRAGSRSPIERESKREIGMGGRIDRRYEERDRSCSRSSCTSCGSETGGMSVRGDGCRSQRSISRSSRSGRGREHRKSPGG